MSAIDRIVSRTVVMPIDNIDTDQIIPAKFLTTTTRSGLGKHLFHAWRYEDDGTPNAHFPLNTPDAAGCEILVAGRNFGCGSSREHAPWALVDYGLRAVISSEIADIFRSNALKNGLVPVIVDEVTHGWLLHNPGVEIEIDIVDSIVRLPAGRSTRFAIDAFAQHCLLNGVDELGFLLSKRDEIERYEESAAA